MVLALSIASAASAQAQDLALIDGRGEPLGLDDYRRDGKWTLVLVRPPGCEGCDRSERELRRWHAGPRRDDASALVLALDADAPVDATANGQDVGRDIAFSRDIDATLDGLRELAGESPTTSPTWLFFAPTGLFLGSDTGAELDSRTLDEMIAADFGNAPTTAPAAAPAPDAVPDDGSPSEAVAEAVTDYDRELDAVMAEVGYAGAAMVHLTLPEARVDEMYALENELEEQLERGDLDGFRDVLEGKRLMVTPNPMMGMILYVHPYQPPGAERAIGRAILDDDPDALAQALDAGAADLDASLYVGDSLGFTPLVMAVQKRSVPMIRTLLEAGASPDAESDKMGATPMDVARILGDEAIADVLRAAGAR